MRFFSNDSPMHRRFQKHAKSQSGNTDSFPMSQASFQIYFFAHVCRNQRRNNNACRLFLFFVVVVVVVLFVLLFVFCFRFFVCFFFFLVAFASQAKMKANDKFNICTVLQKTTEQKQKHVQLY